MTLNQKAKNWLGEVSYVDNIRRFIHNKLCAGSDNNFIGFDKYRLNGAYHWSTSANSVRVDAIRRLVPADATCLDLGCGDAYYFKALKNTAGRLIGVEADYDAVKLARRKLSEYGIVAEIHSMAISNVTRQAIKMPEGADVVFSMDVIEHLPNPEELIDICAEMVAQNGTVLIGTPLFISDDLVSPYHVQEFTIEEFKELCERKFGIAETILLPEKRKDGVVYPENFCILVLHK